MEPNDVTIRRSGHASRWSSACDRTRHTIDVREGFSLTDFVLRSSRVVTARGVAPASIVVRGERIAEVRPHGEPIAGLALEDVGDFVVMPGLVDTHVHINEPGRTEWEGFATAT